MVGSDESGLVNISSGPEENSTAKNAFVQGLEVMETIDAIGFKFLEREFEKRGGLICV